MLIFAGIFMMQMVVDQLVRQVDGSVRGWVVRFNGSLMVTLYGQIMVDETRRTVHPMIFC